MQRKTSELLSTHLGKYTIRENYRPQWLDGLELDFYIEELEVGIEVQGIQHYEYIEHFHKTQSGFEEAKRRDERKRHICSDFGIKLIEIACEQDAILAIDEWLNYPVRYVDSGGVLESRRMTKEVRKEDKRIKGTIAAIGKTRGKIAATRPGRDITPFTNKITNAKSSLRKKLERKGYKDETIDCFLESL